MKKILNIFVFALCIVMTAYASEIPEIINVHDRADILSPSAEKYIASQNEKLSKQCGAKIIFLTQNLSEENSVHEYANLIFSKWNIDSIGRNNSVFVLMCPKKSDYTVIVSEGISASLTNMHAEEILIDYMEPDFDKKDYDSAVIKTYNAFALWFINNYNDVSLSLTEDLSEYEAMADYEEKKAQRKTIGITLSVVLTSFSALTAVVYIRRRARMKRLEKRRLERKKRYMKARQKTH